MSRRSRRVVGLPKNAFEFMSETMVREIPANAQNLYEITRADLPLHCPMEGMSLWNSHPRVYLPIQKSGREKCPYCGATYVLMGPGADKSGDNPRR